MSSRILFILLIVGLVSVKVSNAQPDQGLFSSLTALLQGIGALLPALLANGNAQDNSGVLGALGNLVSTDPTNTNAINAAIASLQQAIETRANCGVLKDGKQYYIQSVNGPYKEGYIQSSLSAIDSQRGAILTRQKTIASKFTAVQISCNVFGLCVNGLCMSRCQGCATGINATQTVAFHLTDTIASYSQWTLSPIGGVAGGPYTVKSDIQQYLNYVRLTETSAVITLNATPLPESEFKFIEVEPCAAMLENGQEYYLKTGDGEYIVVKGVLSYVEEIEQASATKFRAEQWDCNLYGFCVIGTNGGADKCMSRCQDCVSETADRQSVQFHVPNSNRPYSQWTLFNNTNTGRIELRADPREPRQFGNVYFGSTSSGAKQLILVRNNSLQVEFIKAI